MATLVGTQENFSEALKSLMELDMAAIKAYEEAIKCLRNENYKEALRRFKEDHEQHINELSNVLRELGEEISTSGGIKELFTQGKVIFANLLGDEAILKAMRSNEEDTNTAYERVNNHKGNTKEAADILKRGLADERKHCRWIEETLTEKAATS